MLTRLDHAILAVHDLAAASATYERLGFRVSPGGEHPLWGTHNAIVRFGLDYLELLAVKDRRVAEGSGLGASVLGYLERGEGWLGYAVATDDAKAEADELEARGADFDGPMPGQRRRPDGALTEWRAIGLGPLLARPLVPFIIQHLPSDAERLRTFEREGGGGGGGRPGGHSLGARRLRSITVAVSDLAAAEQVYRHELGLRATGYEQNAWLGASSAWLLLGDDLIILAAPSSPGSALAEQLGRRGEGVFAIEVEVDDLDAAVRHVRQAGFAIELSGVGRTVLLGPDGLHGGRIALSQA